MKKFKLFLNFFSFFILIFIFLLFFPLCGDELWNYGFSHNIYIGLIPYKDFNMVITPFYNCLMSVPFHFLGSSIFVFDLFQSIIITLTLFFIYKIYDDNNKLYVISILFFIFYFNLFGSYNFFCFFILILLWYLEKNNKSDYFIGFVLGLAILTKQSIGLCFVLPSIYYIFRDYKKVLKRIIAMFIPISIFAFYLFISNSYNEFFDLCIFGMFDFGKKNYYFELIPIIFTILMFIITIKKIFVNKRDIKNYYLLSFFSIVIPMVEGYHFLLLVLAFIIFNFDSCIINFKKINLKLLSIFLIIIMLLFLFFNRFSSKEYQMKNNIEHFNYKCLPRFTKQLLNDVDIIYNKYDNDKVIFLDNDSYLYKISNNKKTDYFDLINKGNWGYNGSKKLYNALEKNKNKIFILDRYSFNEKKFQIDGIILDYIDDNCEQIDKIGIFEIYIHK